jgi:phenylacetate-CoA ligase
MVEDWAEVFRAAGVQPGDRILFAFSFGPFLGFWLAFEAAQSLGCLCIPAGGMSSSLRARVLSENACTVLCCTPTYALHLADVTRQEGLEAKDIAVRLIVVAGEPGGSLPSTRQRLSEAWNGARIFDHHGMTEVGPVTYESPTEPGSLIVMERSFFVEVIQPESDEPVPEGELGELVLTTLRRTACPLIRYRTGDLVRAKRLNGHLLLQGGILGRVDDMVIIRGVNVYPSALEELIRSLPEIGEYRVTHDTRPALSELSLEAEASAADCEVLEQRLREALALRIPVQAVPAGSLPRFELKARRWQRL